MHIGIDASNLRQGGGVTHLTRLLSAADPHSHGIDRVSVWACHSTAQSLPARSWLEVCSPSWIESGFLTRLLGQQLKLPAELQLRGCDILFSPGGTLPRILSVPSVTMSQNMLPFEPEEAARFGVPSLMWLKLKLLRVAQGRSFQQADGLIFLTDYAREHVSSFLGGRAKRITCIPHGIERRFLRSPKAQRSLQDFSADKPIRLLYVSITMPYKHQIPVARAVKALRDSGVPVEIQFVGASWGRYGQLLREEIDRLDPAGAFLHWVGNLPFEQLHDVYLQADAFVFASSCENLPNIMIEAMAAGLPIASSDRGPMPEVLGDAGIYFDPESAESITHALRDLIGDSERRARLAQSAWEKASSYSWEKCAADTFEFIVDTANRCSSVRR